VSTAGDIDADGYGDIVVGAERYDATGPLTDAGAFTVYFGSMSGPGTALGPITGETAGMRLGAVVAPAWDVNLDGSGDVIVGAYGASGDRGLVRVYPSTGSSLGPPWTLAGTQAGSRFGFSAASAGDINGDGFADIVVGAPQFAGGQTNEGLACLFYANGGAGRARRPRILTVDTTAIDPPGRTGSPSQALVQVLLVSAEGTGWLGPQTVVLECGPGGLCPACVRGNPCDPSPTLPEPPDTETPKSDVEPVPGLDPGTGYHLYLRVASDSPHFPHTPWFSFPHGATSEISFRTTPPLDVPDPGRSVFLFSSPSPNPFTERTRFAYTLPGGGHVRLCVYDVRGRRVATLVDRLERAGPHAVVWNGSSSAGGALPPGIYFVRLDWNGQRGTRKLVLMK
jgi:hypothetical protein